MSRSAFKVRILTTVWYLPIVFFSCLILAEHLLSICRDLLEICRRLVGDLPALEICWRKIAKEYFRERISQIAVLLQWETICTPRNNISEKEQRKNNPQQIPASPQQVPSKFPASSRQISANPNKSSANLSKSQQGFGNGRQFPTSS